MEEKRDYYFCQRENGNENVNTALFTAGIVLLLVCLKRALLLFLVEQWRAWVFLVLNIVVLAIFFTSINKNDEEMKKKKGNCNEVEAWKEKEMLKSKRRSNAEAEEKLEKEKLVEEKVELPKLSKEELNEIVEAFIAMFRQQLALDGRKERDKFYAERKQADMKKHINLSSDGVNGFVLKFQG